MQHALLPALIAESVPERPSSARSNCVVNFCIQKYATHSPSACPAQPDRRSMGALCASLADTECQLGQAVRDFSLSISPALSQKYATRYFIRAHLFLSVAIFFPLSSLRFQVSSLIPSPSPSVTYLLHTVEAGNDIVFTKS